MRQRLKKILKRLLLIGLVLGLIGVLAFSWLCYWPLESKVESIDHLIPRPVEFVLRGEYEDLKATGWVQANVLDDPIHPMLEEQVDSHFASIQSELARMEELIQSFIPLGLIDADLEREALFGEALIAGVFCESTRPPELPQWQELLVLKRLSWKARAAFAAFLNHGFIRDNAVHRNIAQITEAKDDIYKVLLPQVRVRPEQMRGCGGGDVMPPDNVVYLARIRDVFAFSNSLPLIEEAVRLSERAADSGESILARPDFDIEARKGGVVAALDLEPLHGYLTRLLDDPTSATRVLLRYLSVLQLNRLNGSLSLEDPTMLRASGRVDFRTAGMDQEMMAMYRMAPVPIGAGMAGFVPAKDTFMLAALRTDPMHFFQTLLNDVATPAQRELLNENLAQVGEYENLEEFFRDLAKRLDDRVAFSLGRLSKKFDTVDYADWFNEDDRPMPALAFMIKIMEGAKPEEVDEFLRDKVKLLGFGDDLETKEYAGFTYTRAQMIQKFRDFKLVTPCWMLAQDTFIFSTNEDYFRQILDTLKDPTLAIANDDRFRTTLGMLGSEANLSLYIDIEKVMRVPPDSQPGSQPRGFAWDWRNEWITAEKDPRFHSQAQFQKYVREFQARNGARPNEQQKGALWDRVDTWADVQRERYPEFVEEYRQMLSGYRRFNSLGALVTGGVEDELQVELVLQLRERDAK
ncbi:MAG: hypothetical protein GY946_11500 [bacterium]|nr:hypothetical protein [bacterium]